MIGLTTVLFLGKQLYSGSTYRYTMDEEDETYLVIIGDDDESTLGLVAKTNDFIEPNVIKQEQDEPDDTTVGHYTCDYTLMQEIGKHGFNYDIKIEPKHIENESLDINFDLDSNMNDGDKNSDDEHIPEDDFYTSDEGQKKHNKNWNNEDDHETNDKYENGDGDDNYLSDEGQKKASKMTANKNRKNKVKKRKKRNPHQYKSFVKELRDQYEELRKDPDILIDTLTEIMRDVKPPPLPQDYYKVQNTEFVCNICDAVSATLPAAGRHYQEKHGVRYLVCFACGADFRSTTNLYKHEKRCEARDASIVLKARSAFLGRKGRARPFLNIRPNKPIIRRYKKHPCSLCSAVFTGKGKLEVHERMHRGERPHRCHVCPAAYTSHSALVRHMQHHSDIQFICDKCSRSFKIKESLVAHMDTHNPLRKFKCSECDRRFSQKCAMLLHVNRVHRNLPPPFPCQVCPKRYPRMSVLKTHMKKEHNMVLMTRKMFFKSFPQLSEVEVEKAKVILASDAPGLTDYYSWEMDEDVSLSYM